MTPQPETVTLAYSPCPNDTFVFHALSHGLVDRRDLAFDITLSDVEDLNRNAENGRFDVSKLSAAAMLHLGNRYKMLRSGAALGRGCGPLIVAKKGAGLE
ncbi:MAG: MqnA/MqnD/SBP family protein, partial [Thermodesulfobacteriota bacterium]